MERRPLFSHLPHSFGQHRRYEYQVASELKLLYYDEMSHVEADLIFVAGLNGHYLETWQKGDTVWPRDLLHRHIPSVRIWSFHYNATLGGTSNMGKIIDHARELLGKVKQERPDENDITAQMRPIVYIGHSLGGMLIKKAILISRSDPEFSALWHATRGAMFFAVPHHGLDMTAWRKFNTLVLKINPLAPGMVPTKRMEEQAIENSAALLEITDEFRPLQESLYFANFTEGKLMKGLHHLLVDEGRGWMDAPRKFELKLPDGDHLGICQLGRNDLKLDPAFAPHVVITQLQELIGAVKALEHISTAATTTLASLCPKGFHGYFFSKQATFGTCTRIAQRPQFQSWLGDSSESHMLWIQGPPASGKSFLARHIITDLIPPSTQKVAHCFLDDGVPGRESLQGLLRATLHHALRVEPELIEYFLVPVYSAATEGGRVVVSDDEIWTREVLVPMWPEVVARVTAKGVLTMVVDGFDELGVECRQGFLDCLDEFEERAEGREQWERLKVLLVSREDPEGDEGLSGKERFQVYRLTPEDVEGDMKRTVMEGLVDLLGWDEGVFDYQPLNVPDMSRLEEMCEAIVRESKGNYLLAKMASEEVAAEVTVPLATGEERKIEEVFDEVPLDIGGIYDRILKRMHENTTYLPFVRHVLRWAAFQLEALGEEELDTAVALGLAQDETPGSTIATQDLESFQRMFGDTRKMIEKHCGRAVQFQEGKLQLVHESLKERLIADLNPEMAYLEEGPSHATLASLCICYLTMPYFEDSGQPAANSLEEKIQQRLQDYPFARYATLHCFEHVESSRLSWLVVDSQVVSSWRLLKDKTTQFSICWSEMYWFLTREVLHGLKPDADIVEVVALRLPSTPPTDEPSVVESLKGIGREVKHEAADDSHSETDSERDFGDLETDSKATSVDQHLQVDQESELRQETKNFGGPSPPTPEIIVEGQKSPREGNLQGGTSRGGGGPLQEAHDHSRKDIEEPLWEPQKLVELPESLVAPPRYDGSQTIEPVHGTEPGRTGVFDGPGLPFIGPDQTTKLERESHSMTPTSAPPLQVTPIAVEPEVEAALESLGLVPTNTETLPTAEEYPGVHPESPKAVGSSGHLDELDIPKRADSSSSLADPATKDKDQEQENSLLKTRLERPVVPEQAAEETTAKPLRPSTLPDSQPIRQSNIPEDTRPDIAFKRTGAQVLEYTFSDSLLAPRATPLPPVQKKESDPAPNATQTVSEESQKQCPVFAPFPEVPKTLKASAGSRPALHDRILGKGEESAARHKAGSKGKEPNVPVPAEVPHRDEETEDEEPEASVVPVGKGDKKRNWLQRRVIDPIKKPIKKLVKRK